MPTLEDRFAALEQTLSAVVRQLQQQIVEQRREVNQRFDILEKALSHQFGMIDARFTRLEQRIEQQTIDFRWKFDEISHYATETRGIVEMHQRDIREMKEDIREVKGRLDSLENKVDRRFDQMDQRFDQVIALITKQNN